MEQSMMWLYEVVRIKLGKQYPNIMYQTVRDDVEGDVGIFLYESSNDKEDMTGEDVYRAVKVQVQVNAEKSVEGLGKALDYLTKFVDRMESEQSNIEVINFIDVKHIGPKAVPIGKNKYGIQVVKCTIDLRYVFKNK